MRENKKKTFLLCAVSAACLCLCFFGGCREEKQVKTDFEAGFYSLTEAYENGWLTKADVKQISDYRGGAQTSPELDSSVEKRIRDFAAKKYSHGENIIPAESFTIRYYGEYNGSYAVYITSDCYDFPTVITVEEVAGIKFSYPDSNTMKIYKERN